MAARGGLDERDWQERRGFEVRSSKLSELRTPNFGSRLSRLSRASRFDRLIVLSHVEGRATVCGAGGLFQHLVRRRIVSRVEKRLLVRCVPTQVTGILGNPRKRNFAKEKVRYRATNQYSR